MSDNKPPDDELAGTEQPFVQHLYELRDRLLRAVYGIAAIFTVLAFFPAPPSCTTTWRCHWSRLCLRAPK